MSFGARAVIRLDALRHNLEIVRQASPSSRITAVVKANAYGHGILDVAAALQDADGLAVARLSEAMSIRQAGIDTPLVILSGVASSNDLELALEHECELVVHNDRQLGFIEASSQAAGLVWLKIDTGMHRLGFPIAQVSEALARLSKCANVQNIGLMTHLANADDTADPTTKEQLAEFESVTRQFDGDVSIANSPGLLGWSRDIERFHESRKSGTCWVRAGISLYGIAPFHGQCGSDIGLQPVMQFESRVAAVKQIPAGSAVGYGGCWRAETDTTIGILSAGYGDGYSRHFKNGTPVLVNGRQVPLAGRVSMDSCAVDLGPAATDQVGDPVVLWGDELPVETVAHYADSIPYELVCGVTHREASKIVDRAIEGA